MLLLTEQNFKHQRLQEDCNFCITGTGSRNVM